MAQYISNHTPTSSLSGWSKTAGTLTATADGARWVGSSGEVRVRTTSCPKAWIYVAGIQIRRNSATSGWPKSIYLHSSGTSGNPSVDLTNVTFPVGVWITIPTLQLRHRIFDEGGDFETKNFDVAIANPTASMDVTIRYVRAYDSGQPADANALSASDAAFAYTQPVNSRTLTFSKTALAAGSVMKAVSNVSWAWGDSSSTAGVAAGSGQKATGVAKTYAANGRPVVTLTATAPPRTGYAEWTPPARGTASSSQTMSVPSGTLAAGFSFETDWLNVVTDASASIAPSLDPISTYAWDWGDGQTTAANASKYASHSYAAPGTYNVTLTIRTPSGGTNRSATVTKSVVVIAPPNPDNYFVASKDLLTVAFVPSIQDGSSYAWTFGDGATSTDKEPVHAYEQPGTYSVSLTVNGTLTTTQTVTVTDTYAALRSLMDALRLEVATPHPAGTLYNRLPNPSGELGGWAWLTPVTNSYLTGSTTSHQTADKGIGGAKLIYRSSGAGTQVIYSTPVKVTAGQYASVQLNSPYVDGYYRVTVEALNAAGALLGSSATTGFQQASATAVVRTTPYLLPAGTTHARVRLNHYSDTASGTPTVGKLFQFRRAMLATAATSAELTALPYAEYNNWQDLIGPASEITVTRAALDVGTLSATVLDSTLDPATNGAIRPGQAVRLRAKTQDSSGNVAWASVFTGTVTEADVEYVPVKGETPGPKATRIKLSASDAVTTLSRTGEARGVAKIAELPELLEGVGVPFEINGSSGQVPAASVVAENPNASVLDQVAITRDTDGGYAYVDRDNVLQAREPAYMPTVAVGVIDERAYSDIAASFNTGECINSVTIKWLRYTPGSGVPGTEDYIEPKVEEIIYGPYEDLASIEEWGLRPATFTMQGVENPTTIAAKGAAILAANAVPARMVSDVVLPIRYQEDLVPGKALLDLYDLVRLGYVRTETDELARVTFIKHAIRATKDGGRWSMTLGFSADGAVAPPQLVAAPPVSVPEVTPESLEAPANTPLYTANSTGAVTVEVAPGMFMFNITGSLVRSGAVTPNATTGDVPDETVCTIAAPHRPSAARYVMCLANAVHIVQVAITPTGEVRLLSFPSKPSGAFTPAINGCFVYPG